MMRGVPRGLTLHAGFTLTELSVVLVIVTLLISGMILPLSAQDNIRRAQDTQRTLGDASEALIGFATTHDRLPCPAVDGATGVESPSGGGAVCTATTGFLPATTLGISPVDQNGYALDAWNQRIRYAVTSANGGAFTTTSGMRSATLTALAPNLRVSVSAAAAATDLTTTAVAVIWSVGKNGSDLTTGGVSADESENPNPNSGAHPDPTVDRFVSHEPTPAFDDIVVWLSPNILFNRMIAAGRLP